MPDVAPSAAPAAAPAQNTQASSPVAESAESKPKSTSEPSKAANDNSEAKPAPKKWRIKGAGREHEVDSEEKLIALAQMGLGARQAFTEADKIKQENAQWKQRIKESPWDVLAELGLDPRELSEKKLTEIIADQELTDEQRELKALKDKNKSYEQKEAEREKAEHAAQVAKLSEHFRGQYDNDFTKVLNESGLPKTPAVVRRMAELQLEGMKAGEDYEAPLAAVTEMVREEINTNIRETFAAMDGDQILKLLDGTDIANKIRRADLARLRAPASITNARAPAQAAAAAPPGAKEEPKYISRDEWHERLKKITD